MHHVVPKASNVAGALQPPVPDNGGNGRALGAALACPHSGGPCPALVALFAPAGSNFDSNALPGPDPDDAFAWLRSVAPCDRCRFSFAAKRDSLRHLRLGQREREILLAAADADCVVLTEPGMTRSLSAARRRAALSLTKSGLVEAVAMPAASPVSGARFPRATVALTPLGHYVLNAYGRFISSGKPVRWTRPARGATLPGLDPEALVGEALGRCQAALKDTLSELMGVLVAAVARPLKSPGTLDSVTRHLERKATTLRTILSSCSPREASPGLR